MLIWLSPPSLPSSPSTLLIALGDFVQRPLCDRQRLQCRLEILVRMARQKRLSLPPEFLDVCEPALDVLMGGRIGLPRNVPAQAGVLQRLFDRMLDDVEAKPGVFEILVCICASVCWIWLSR